MLTLGSIASGQPRSALVAGHRGHASGPECTIVASQIAIDQGADYIEMDVQTSADGVLVNIHDLTVDRTTDGTGNVKDFTLAQLKQLDAGSWKGVQFTGERIPTIEEMLNLCKTHGKGAILDMKGATPANVASTVNTAGFDLTKLTILTWTPTQASQFHAVLPNATIACVASWNQPSTWTSTYFSQMKSSGIDALAYEFNSITRAFVVDAKAAGLPVHTFTINSAAKAQQLLDYGVECFTTDNAGLILNGVDWDPTFRVRSCARQANGTVLLKWRAIVGDSYRIERSPNLLPGSWTTVTSTIPASVLPTHTLSPSGTQEFYRVIRE